MIRSSGAAPGPTAALFTVGDGGEASVDVPDLHGVSRVMLTAEPAGGSPHPTGRVVIVASPA